MYLTTKKVKKEHSTDFKQQKRNNKSKKQSKKPFPNTCIFPIKWANSTRPTMAMRMANDVSPIKVLVDKFCPYELRQQECKKINQTFLFIY